MIGALILGYLFFFSAVLQQYDKDDISEGKKLFRSVYFVGTVAALGYCADVMVRIAIAFAWGLL
jgi:hypothetical protein